VDNPPQKIDKLTPEQEAMLPVYRDKWFAVGSCCDPADTEMAEAAILGLYSDAGCEAVPFQWVSSPLGAFKLLEAAGKAESEFFSFFHGAGSAYWVSLYKYCQEVLGIEYGEKETEQLELWTNLTLSCGWWWPFDDTCIVCDRPSSIVWEQDRSPPRLHNLEGPAVSYRDDYKIYCIQGVRVKPHVVMEPDTITPQEIDEEANVERRRILLQQLGEDKYLIRSEAEKVHEDEFGMLYRKDFPDADDEPLVMVRVVNSTPEPDGSFKIVYLRVPPTTTTAREGVAWTMGLDSVGYAPAYET
jgi:hypothetical protein